ncbi:hypothetical protein BKA70DRAFT_1108445, partial [Coprinopsis sp. MPI-PUGE-AT-0042]
AEDDVLAVQEVLLEHLPIEIIHLILDKAEYWPRLLAQRESEPPLRICNPISDKVLHTVISFPGIPESCLTHESRMKLRRVVFHILSHDQGWGGDPNLTGRFEGSWTWFEASIIRGEIHRLLEGASENAKSGPGVPFRVPNPSNGEKVWHLQSNVRASPSHAEMHEVVWDLTQDASLTSPSLIGQSDLLKTKGWPGSRFRRRVQPGDRIAVFARAQYPGWVNNVLFVDVQIFYAL